MTFPSQITVPRLSQLIGLPDAPVIVDICIDDDFKLDPRLLPTAFRHPFQDIAALAPPLKGAQVVVVCQKGLKLSQGAAAILRDHGVDAASLEGGNWAWRDACEILIPAASLPARNAEGRSVWVTRQRPKIDRIACPWLIRRFIDPKAQFLYVEASEVLAVAEKFKATPFDVENVFWSHRGERCTFDTMVEEFGLQTEALLRLATIVRGADTGQNQIAAESAGLLATSLGLSHMYEDDLSQLNAGMGLYDALYRWARDTP